VCGICGFVTRDRDQPVNAEMLDRMVETLHHRGPDDRGVHCAPGVGLAVRRLSIVDISGGSQPLTSEDGTVVLVCNGEIYNAPELRSALVVRGHRFRSRSDAEVIVHLYEERGTQCLERLRGMFAFALWDGRERRLLLARDRLGIKPLLYAETSTGLFFGSEAKAILASGGVERRLDLSALEELFRFGFVMAPKSLAAGLRQLEPGHFLEYREGALSIRRYWNLSFPPKRDYERALHSEDWACSLREKLIESVRLHLRSDVLVGTWLSPGLDSSSVTSLVAELTGASVPTFSLAFEDGECDEIDHAEILADMPGFRLGSERTVCGSGDLGMLPRAVWHCEDISVTGIEIPRMILARSTGGKVKVVLTGEGADELLGGYRWYHGERLLRPLAFLPRPVRWMLQGGPIGTALRPRASRLLFAAPTMDLHRFHAMVAPDHWREGVGLISPQVLEAAGQPEWDPQPAPPPEFASWHPFCQVQYYDLCMRMPNFVIRDLDRSSMAYSVEARVPFLDHELVELCSRIPPRFKMRWLQEKYVLRQAMRDRLPPVIAQRPKRGMEAPVDAWFRGTLPEQIEEVLTPASLRRTGYFEPAAVGRLLEQHRGRQGQFGRQLLGVTAVELWHRMFVEGNRAVPMA
jgi:asparagine synthase (glutamine-hydrolysing)